MSTFKSKSNRAFNQSESCEAPELAMGDKPTTLTMNCSLESMLEGHLTKQLDVSPSLATCFATWLASECVNVQLPCMAT